MITELTLRLHGLPERPVAIRAAFPDIGSACRSAVALVGAGVTVTRCELLDEATLRAVNAFKGTSYEETPSLFVELDGGDEELASTREVCGWENVIALEAVTTAEARTQLWDARHNAAFAVAAPLPASAGSRRTSASRSRSSLARWNTAARAPTGGAFPPQ